MSETLVENNTPVTDAQVVFDTIRSNRNAADILDVVTRASDALIKRHGADFLNLAETMQGRRDNGEGYIPDMKPVIAEIKQSMKDLNVTLGDSSQTALPKPASQQRAIS